MSRAGAALANGLWLLSSLPEALRFRRACDDVAGTQARLLLGLLRRNAGTVWGRRYGFGDIRTVADFQARVPLADFDDYHEAIQRIGAGEQGVLTRDPVRLLEPTSGSTAATKLIPYTAALQGEFGRAIAPWIVDLFRHDPRLLAGPAYWSVSPAAPEAYTPGGLPIGFEDDRAYLGGARGRLLRAALAVPSGVRRIADTDSFRYVTLLFLLRCPSLTLISVWNPTFLTLLVEPLAAWWLRLADDIQRGTCAPPAPLPDDLAKSLRALLPPHRRRAAEVRAICEASLDPATRHARLWPQLQLVSCWTEAGAAPFVPEVARLFPQARIQGKGLLATEGFVSFPLVGREGASLALRSHFFEFLPDGADGPPRLAHELETGATYRVALTTGGGFLRYQLHDVVEVVGHLRGCPLLCFVGKAAHVSDHVGEKLNERHIRAALDGLFAVHRLRPAFAMLACETGLAPPAYTLFIEADAEDAHLLALGAALDATLCENFHYRHCRDLGQLGPLRLFRIHGGATQSYLAACQGYGQRLGDIKPTALHRRAGWSGAFRGQFLAESSA